MQNYHDLDRYQDILGQLPMLQVYSHILYLFPMPEGVSKEQIVHKLETVVTKVREEVPWMGARVINVGSKPGDSGLYKVISVPRPENIIDVRDLSNVLPTYAEFKERKVPVSQIDPDLLTPVPGFPEKAIDSDENPAHVVRLQVSFVQGGLIIDFCIEHNMADAGGHFGLVGLIAMTMRGEEFPKPLLEQINLDRRNLFALLGPDEPTLDHSHHKRPSITASDPLARPEPARYHILRFTADKLAKLKDMASQPEGFDSDVPFISTDDALSAFLWQRLTMVRSQRFPPETRSRLSRAIDGRKALQIPPGYMGDVIHNVTTFMTFGEITGSPLSTVASRLRKRLNECNTTYHVRSFATFVAREPDKSTITYTGQFNPETDIGCSSVRGRASHLFPDFGVLGRPDFIRRPPSVPFRSVLVFIPGNLDGDCDASVCLADSDLASLEQDPVWNEHVEYIG